MKSNKSTSLRTKDPKKHDLFRRKSCPSTFMQLQVASFQHLLKWLFDLRLSDMLSVHALIGQQRRFLSSNKKIPQLGGKISCFISIWGLWLCSQMCGCDGEQCQKPLREVCAVCRPSAYDCPALALWQIQTPCAASTSGLFCISGLLGKTNRIALHQTVVPKEILVGLELPMFSLLHGLFIQAPADLASWLETTAKQAQVV